MARIGRRSILKGLAGGRAVDGYVPASSEPPTDVHRRSRAALERAGVLRT